MTREEFKRQLEERLFGMDLTDSIFYRQGALWAFDLLNHFYGPDQVPPAKDEDGCSENVLVDLNGRGDDFLVGWYDHENKEWMFHSNDTSMFESAHMTWTYIKRNDLTK